MVRVLLGIILRLSLSFAACFFVCGLIFGSNTQFNTWLCSSWFLIPKYYNPGKSIYRNSANGQLVFFSNHSGVMYTFSDDSLSEFIDMNNNIENKIVDIRYEISKLQKLKQASSYADDIYSSKISNMSTQLPILYSLQKKLENAAYKTLLLNKIGNIQADLQLLTEEEYLNYQAEVVTAKDVLKTVNNL